MGKYVCINLVWLRKYPADAKPDKLLKGFFDVVATEQHILRLILVNLLHDYLVIFKCEFF